MDAILAGATRYRRRQTLLKMTNGFSLDDAYRTTLDSIREQEGHREKLGITALMWISCSERPLKADELCHALAVEVGTAYFDFDNVPAILTLLSCTLGLVKVDEQSSTVRLVHFTLQEYFAAHPNLFITPHSMMAEICLTFLNIPYICELPFSLDYISLPWSLLHYASCYWGFHARKDVTENVKQLALRLLQRDANHISADILLREETVDFLSWGDRYYGRRPDLRGFTGLHCIAYMEIAEIATDMVDMKMWDLNGRDSKGATPLIWALKYGNYTLTRLLLEQEGVDPTLSDEQGLTPLTQAAKAGDHGLVKLLLERKDVDPDLADAGGRTPLSYAGECGHDDVVKILLERGDVNPDSSNKYGRTPLSFAAWSGNEGAVRLFLEHGYVNPDSSDKYGQTPLLWAARSGHEGVISLLLEREGVNPDTSDIYSQTPLLWAARSEHEGAVKLLLYRKDLNPNSPNTKGRTPLSFAASSGHDGIVKLFLQRQDINPDLPDNKGRTPLSRAAIKGHEGVVKLLLGRGDVGVNSPDKDGRTPLSLAAMRGCEGVVKLLSQSNQLTLKSPQDNVRTEKTSDRAMGNQEAAVLPQAPPREVDNTPWVTGEVTDLVSPQFPGESRPNTPDAPPPVSASTLVFWVSYGILLLSVIVIVRSQAGRKHNLLG